MYCKSCGAELSEGALFCEKCGNKVVQPQIHEQAQTPVYHYAGQEQKDTPKKKSPIGKIFAIVGGVVAAGLLGFVGYALLSDMDDGDVKESKKSKYDDEEILDIDVDELSKEDRKYLDELESILSDYNVTMDTLDAALNDTEDYDVMSDALNTAASEFEKIDKDLASLSTPSDMEELQNAAKKLMDDTASFSADGEELMVYFSSVFDELAKIDELGEDFDDMYDTYYDISDYFSDTTDVPSYIIDSHKNLADYFNYMIDALETMYIATAIEEEYEIVDEFRWASADLELDRVYQEMEYGLDYWISDLSQQTDRIIARTDSLDKQYEEIQKNVDAIRNGGELTPISILDVKPEVTIDYDAIDTIYPALYNREDYLVHMSAYSDNADTDVIVSVGVEGFSQEYSKKITLTSNMVQLYIHPPVLADPGNLSSAKDTQLKINVSDASTGEIYIQESLPMHIMSRNDVSLDADKYGATYCLSFLAMLTPEAPKLDEVKRMANQILVDNECAGLIGYQSDEYESIYQVMALQYAMSDWGVLYDQSSFSYSASNAFNQRVKFPTEVIEKKSGLCVETAMTIASMAMSLDMNAVLIFPPGHCMVAVELGEMTGDYILLETTALPTDDDTEFWWAGSANEINEMLIDAFGEYTAINCSVAKAMDFQTLNY